MKHQTGDMSGVNQLVSGLRISQLLPVLRKLGASIDSDCYINSGLYFHNVKHDYGNLKVGKRVYIGPQCFFDLSDTILIGNEVTLAMRCMILTHFNAGNSKANEYYPSQTAPVEIDDGVYVGANATILPGIRIGAGAVVAAGAVVTKDVPDNVLTGGIPAQTMRELN